MAASGAVQNAFERARKTYIELLTAKERTRIETPTSLSDLLLQADSISTTFKQHRQRKTTQFLHGFHDVSLKLKPFERLVEGVCKSSPAGGELIWGSVSFVLEMARNSVEVFDEVLDFFLTMAQEMEYVKGLEDTFSDTPLVVSVIEALYVAIIDFWVKAVKYYRPKPSKRARGYMAQKFQVLQAEIAAQKSRLQHVASAQHFADSASHHEHTQQQFRTTRQARLVKWINPPSYEADFHSADKHHHDGTCEWIRSRKQYREWIERKANPFLVIYGVPGAGKTILSSWLINQASAYSRTLEHEHVTLYHYFKESDDSKRTPLAVTRSLLDQLYSHLRLSHHPILSNLESAMEALSEKSHINFEQLWALCSTYISEYCQSRRSGNWPAVTIVLDAMDECKGSKPLVRELQKLVHAASGGIRVVITARKSGAHVDEFARASLLESHFLEIGKEDVKHDIASFTKYKIDRIERLRGAQHTILRNSVIAELGKVENHQGMFLWTYLMCKEVKRQLRVSDIWQLLQNLPKGLDAMYARICKRLAENDQHRDFGRTVLQWIVASSRPLRFAELEQALKTMQIQANQSQTKGFFDEEGLFEQEYGVGLLWSRKDIVEACGDLVAYTGLDEGDMIGLVHLSARQFLCNDISKLSLPPDLTPSLKSIATFLVDIPRAECAMGTTCLDYLLSGSLHSDKRFKHSLALRTQVTLVETSKHDLTKLYPLFDYAVMYWPEYVLNTLQVNLDHQDAQRLLAKVALFITHSFSVFWLEEYVRQSGTEFSAYTAQRFSELPSSAALFEIFRWAHEVTKMLEDFAQTLSRAPQMVRLCLPQSAIRQSDISLRPQIICGPNKDNTNDDPPLNIFNTIPPLEKSSRSWIHYDPFTDSLFAVEGVSDAIRLKRQVIKTGMRLRPALGAVAESVGISLHFQCAAVSTRAGFIAATFLSRSHESNKPLLHQTVCWCLITSGTLSSANTWAEIAFIDRSTSPQTDIFEAAAHQWGDSASIIAFRSDNTLVAPGGIWNLLNEERVDGPASIYQPDPELMVTNTCFSGRGERVARINTGNPGEEVLEVLDISGTSLCRHRLPKHGFSLETREIYLLSFSDTGEKIIFVNEFAQSPNDDHSRDANNHLYIYFGLFRFMCFVVEEKKEITISTPFSIHRLRLLRFSRDETKLVGSINAMVLTGGDLAAEKVEYAKGSSIGVWTFAKDGHGHYLDHADMIFLFKDRDPDITFCLTPPTTDNLVGNVIIASRNGVVSKRPISLEWCLDEEIRVSAARSSVLPPASGTGPYVHVVKFEDVLGLIICSHTR
ncbi:hypothetical protein FPV67DRAFT_1421882 [Lyophyllum atratum]|nr:hypothetical protein FPV67DRAFT_1421882 [Lyophyllum atratum]